MKWGLILFFLSVQTQAEDQGPFFENTVTDITQTSQRSSVEPILSDRYQQGAFFLYDCDDHHFACVNEEGYQECKNRRVERLEAKQVNLSCAPMKEFESFETCKDYQQAAINRLLNKEFCFQDTGESMLVF